MISLKPGEKRFIADLRTGPLINILVKHDPADIDVAAFGLNGDKKIGDDRYTVLFSNGSSPDKSLSWTRQSVGTTISVDLDKVPAHIDRITVTATHDTMELQDASVLEVSVNSAVMVDAKPTLGSEKAVMLLDIYRHSAGWRLGAVVQGFNGGLEALVKHFGGEVASDETSTSTSGPAAAPAPAPVPVSVSVSLSKVDLRKQKVGVSLKKLGIEHEKAEVQFIIDASGSMIRLYQKGVVQETVERIAPVALRLDDDGAMPTWFYASDCAKVEDLTAHNLDGFIARTMPVPGAKVGATDTAQKGFFGGPKKAGGRSIGYGNNEPVVMNALLATVAPNRTTPLLVIFLTDGGIDSSTSRTIKAILTKEASRPIFWQFVGVGKADYGVLRDLDTIAGRIVDNAGFFSVDDLSKVGDDELYDRILSEFPAWLKAARAARILR
jgi:stress response protein SCP2